MLYGRYPFYSDRADELFKQVKGGLVHIPNGVKVQLDAKIMLYQLMNVNPLRRPSAIRLLRTNYLQEGAVEKMKRLEPPAPYQMRKPQEESQVVPQKLPVQKPQLHHEDQRL